MSWAGTGEAYAASYAQLCAGTGERLRELAGAAEGRLLLDVGAGEGTLAVAWVDAGWQVTACEPEPSMREAARRQHPTLPLAAGALPALDFADASFDVVVANFVLNHLPDPRAGAEELRRVARSIVIATTWTATPSVFWAEVTARAGLQSPSVGRLHPDKDFERTAAGFESMLRDAGWQAEVSEFSWVWLPTPHALWRSVVGGVAGAGAFYRTLSDADRERFRQAFDSIAAERGDGDAIPMQQTAAIAVHHLG